MQRQLAQVVERVAECEQLVVGTNSFPHENGQGRPGLTAGSGFDAVCEDVGMGSLWEPERLVEQLAGPSPEILATACCVAGAAAQRSRRLDDPARSDGDRLILLGDDGVASRPAQRVPERRRDELGQGEKNPRGKVIEESR